ncbi:MAG: hypothetical protein WAL70_09035 [Aeromicrobium sp.]
MKAPAWLAAATLVVGTLAGCTSTDAPGDASDKSSPEAAATSPQAASDSPKTPRPTQFPSPNYAESASRDIPSNAMRKDGKTPIKCAEWPGLSNDRQRSLVFSALVQSLVIPVTDSKVSKARQTVDSDCRNEPKSVAYMVAMRAAERV